MTDFTLSAGNFMRPWRTPWGACQTRTMKLSTGISTLIIRVGTVVGLDVNSTQFQDCIVPSSQASTMAIITSTAIVGVAAEGPGAAGGNPSSTNTQGTLCQVWEANPMVEFIANTRNGLLNSTCVGQAKELSWDSTLNITLVNIGGSSLATPQPRVIVTELVDQSGDSGGRVLCKFIPRDVTSSLSTANLLAFFK